MTPRARENADSPGDRGYLGQAPQTLAPGACNVAQKPQAAFEDGMMASVPGSHETINEFYLDREGRGEEGGGDDDTPDAGPDSWLDPLAWTVDEQDSPLAAAEVRAGTEARAHRSRSTRPSSGARDSGSTSGRRRRLPTQAQQDLASAAAGLNQRSAHGLSYAQVVEKLRLKGWKVSRHTLSEAIRVTNTPWGGPSKKAKPSSQAKSTSKVKQPGERTGSRAPAPPPTKIGADLALVREVTALQKQSQRVLSQADVMLKLAAKGRTVSKARLKSAMRATKTPWGWRGGTPTGGDPVLGAGSNQKISTRRPSIEPPRICEACGLAESSTGRCGCS